MTMTLTVVLLALLTSQDVPKPQAEHAWLQPLAGDWATESEVTAGLGQPSLKLKGEATGRRLGGFWATIETRGEFSGTPFSGLLTLGWDPRKKAYTGTWVGSGSDYLWIYQGKLDAAGKLLTLETEGPCQETPGTLAKYKEVIEWKSADHFVMTSSVDLKGEWATFAKMQFRRKKKE
jgi:hypothetical protein